MALTDTAIRAAKPGTVLRDGRHGLELHVGKTGVRTWKVAYRSPTLDRARRLTIGHYLDPKRAGAHAEAMAAAGAAEGRALTLQDARARAIEIHTLVKEGQDPADIEQAKREAAERAAVAEREAPTLAALAEEWWQRELSSTPSGAERLRQLHKDILPTLGGVRVKDLSARQVVLVLDGVRDRGAVVLANRLHGSLSRLLSFGVERGVIDFNPIARLRKTAEQTRERVLSEAEVGVFWTGIQTCGLEEPTTLALRLVLVLGCRPGEIAEARKAEFDLGAGWWRIPATRMKSRRAHDVPLPALARELIARAGELSGASAYLFPSSQGADRPMAVRSLSRALDRKHGEPSENEQTEPKNRRGLARKEASVGRLGLAKLTPHDLRRTARTHWARIGIDPLTAEALLAHALPLAGIAAVYDRHNRAAEKQAALAKWDRELRHLCALLPAESNVITLPTRGAI